MRSCRRCCEAQGGKKQGRRWEEEVDRQGCTRVEQKEMSQEWEAQVLGRGPCHGVSGTFQALQPPERRLAQGMVPNPQDKQSRHGGLLCHARKFTNNFRSNLCIKSLSRNQPRYINWQFNIQIHNNNNVTYWGNGLAMASAPLPQATQLGYKPNVFSFWILLLQLRLIDYCKNKHMTYSTSHTANMQVHKDTKGWHNIGSFTKAAFSKHLRVIK